MSATTVPTQANSRHLALADPATYRRTLHLVLDLPIGVATFTVAVTLVSTGAALAITIVGLPLLAATLLVARCMGRVERTRARSLLGVDVADPPASPRGLRRLSDPAGWRAVGYAVVMLPLGVVTSTVAMTGWATALSALAYPAYAPFLDHSSVSINDVIISGPGWQIATSLTGAVLLLVMPTVVRGLARLDAAAVRRLL